MDKVRSRWHSDRVHQDISLIRWGHWGTPLLLFPTAGGDAEEVERFQMVRALSPLLGAGRLKLYSVDSLAGRAWLSKQHSARHCSWLQNQFHDCVYREIVPAIRNDCHSTDIGIVSAGSSIGAYNAVAVLARYPDAFTMAIGMSGTYDLESWLHGELNQDFYFSSPIHFLPQLAEGPQLSSLRERLVLLPTGEGNWENPEESWRLAQVLGSKGIPNRVDSWGTGYDHDWTTWREMLPKYLDELLD